MNDMTRSLTCYFAVDILLFVFLYVYWQWRTGYLKHILTFGSNVEGVSDVVSCYHDFGVEK